MKSLKGEIRYAVSDDMGNIIIVKARMEDAERAMDKDFTRLVELTVTRVYDKKDPLREIEV